MDGEGKDPEANPGAAQRKLEPVKPGLRVARIPIGPRERLVVPKRVPLAVPVVLPPVPQPRPAACPPARHPARVALPPERRSVSAVSSAVSRKSIPKAGKGPQENQEIGRGKRIPPQPTPSPKADTDRHLAIKVGFKMPFFFFSRRYRPLERMAVSGMGMVFRAHDAVLNADVALKFPSPQTIKDRETIDLFRKEATLAMCLSHANIVRLHNVENENGRFFLVMEFVDGENLRQILKRMGPLSLKTVVAIAESCASALDYAHTQSILHRDLKPENIMITRDNVLKIVDFGTAVLAHQSGGSTHIEGTPSYMSPEQIRGEVLDGRTDIFSMGAVLSELLTGKRTFPFDNNWDKLLAMEPAGLSTIQPAVATVLSKALSKQREGRWATAVEFAEALRTAAEKDQNVVLS